MQEGGIVVFMHNELLVGNKVDIQPKVKESSARAMYWPTVLATK